MKEILIKKQKGFNGTTHFLIAVFIFQWIWILPIFSQQTNKVRALGFLGIAMFWLIVSGSALFPDLDNSASTALFQLGKLGRILNVFMIAIASTIYTLFHTRKDKHAPGSYHRLFWHSPFSCLLVGLVPFFILKDNEYTLFLIIKDSIANKSIQYISFQELMGFIFVYIMCCSAIHLASNMVCYRAGKIAGKKFFNILQHIISIFCLCYLGYFANEGYIRFMGYAVALGAFLHCVGDAFSLGSIPFVFPIPVKGQFWWRPHIPGQLETGGVANKILDIILLISVIVMFLFMTGKLTL